MNRLKIALFGSHRFAVEVARDLDAEAYEILIADKDEENLAQARELGLRALPRARPAANRNELPAGSVRHVP